MFHRQLCVSAHPPPQAEGILIAPLPRLVFRTIPKLDGKPPKHRAMSPAMASQGTRAPHTLNYTFLESTTISLEECRKVWKPRARASQRSQEEATCSLKAGGAVPASRRHTVHRCDDVSLGERIRPLHLNLRQPRSTARRGGGKTLGTHLRPSGTF
jgi:hypothetical protein